jgi:hypothetical protein
MDGVDLDPGAEELRRLCSYAAQFATAIAASWRFSTLREGDTVRSR